jgi:hypothetical protein
MGKPRRWWQHGFYGGRHYWPEDIPDTLDGWLRMFMQQGYIATDNKDHEVGFEKIAIFIGIEDNRPTHVAKSNGKTWKSKLGRWQDIEHKTLDVLEGDDEWSYGVVERILARPTHQPMGDRRNE